MRTSNKILTGFLVVIFTVPLLLAFTLQGKIKKGEYTIEKFKNKGSQNYRSGAFTAYKVVKVVSPDPEYLRCHLKPSNEMSYSYFNDNSKDSLAVFTSNDTLIVRYIAAAKSGDRSAHSDYTLNVNLPHFNNLVVDGAIVIIDSLPASSGSMSITLKNNGQIRDDSRKRDEDVSRINANEGSTKNKSSYVPSSVQVRSARNNRSAVKLTLVRAEIPDLNIKGLMIYDLLFRI